MSCKPRYVLCVRYWRNLGLEISAHTRVAVLHVGGSVYHAWVDDPAQAHKTHLVTRRRHTDISLLGRFRYSSASSHNLAS